LVPARAKKGDLPARPDDWFANAFVADPSDAEGNGEPQAPTNGDARKKDLRIDGLDAFTARATALPPDRNQRTAILEASSITVRFGGLIAVSDASIEVREGEIVGLIGPNGAGKTTLFNAILGLNDPTSGRIRLYGHDATGLPPHQRARLGVARSFQVIQLFGELTVFDNLLVATHLHNESGLISNLAASARTLLAERDARRRVTQVLQLLGLEDVAHLGVQGLPFGVLRMVELGRALVTGARFVMLDEPASGLNNAETDRLTEVVRGIRALGVSVLLIEHDVRMVTGVSDYVYVLDQGQLISQGRPVEIQRDPRVIHAYLGAAESPDPAPEKVTV
ncbi:MAG: ABC transporter ATP-binding protein, partial [Actinomycetota bacterium]